MDTDLIVSIIVAVSTVILVAVTCHYARSTHHMLEQMRVQSRIQAISAEVTARCSQPNGAESNRVKVLLQELKTLSKEELMHVPGTIGSTGGWHNLIGEQQATLFKVTSWGLLVVAWAWLVSTCKSVPATPNPLVRFIGENATYVMPFGILIVAWCYAVVDNFKVLSVNGAPANVGKSDAGNTTDRIEIGLRFLMHVLICWVLTFSIAEFLQLPAAGCLSFLGAVGITTLERSWVMSGTVFSLLEPSRWSERKRAALPVGAPTTTKGEFTNG